MALVCATSGEVGEISDPSLATRATLGEVRERELRAACAVLGVKELYLLGHRDSGMRGSESNRHPDALIQASFKEVVDGVVRVIRRVRPQVVVTFDPNGGYGHPDHVVMHRATTEAFAAAGDPACRMDGAGAELAPFCPSKLYYIAFLRSMAREFQRALAEAGVASDFAKMDIESVGVPDEEITTVLDVGAYARRKELAAACHRTQIRGDSAFSWLPEGLRRKFTTTEHLVRAAPSPGSVGRKEADLFEGL